MASFLRPRRGKKSTATSDGIILKRGEVFFEVPDTGVGTGNGKIKMGDGTTSYASLPYFLDGSGSGSGVIRLTEEEWEALTPEQQASGAYVVDFDEEEGTTNAELAIKMNQIMNKTIPTNGIIGYDMPEGGTIPEGFELTTLDGLSTRYNEETDYLQVFYNGDWSNAIYIGKKLDPTKLALTQEEFIAICNQGLQSMMTVGAIVTLNNEKCSQYEVIDVNHDSTTGTVDLMGHTQVGNMRFDGSSQDYNVSEIRTWLNSNYYDLFDLEIRNLMQPMTVVTKGLTQQDKVKLLSWRELGLQYNSSYMDSTDGGEQYPVFTAGAYNTAVPDRWRAAGNYGNSSYYWLRSRGTGSTTSVWRVGSDGTCDSDRLTNSRGVLPVLRF